MSDAVYRDPDTGIIVADNAKLHLDAHVISDASKADRAEHRMTIQEAFRVHKKAIFWSMALSAA